MLNRQRWYLLFAATVIFVISLVVTVSIMSPRGPAITREEAGNDQPPQSQGPALKAGAELVLHYTFQQGDGVSRRKIIPEEWIGNSLEAVQQERPDWNVVRFSPDRVDVRVPCPGDTLSQGYVKLVDGKVAVYEGKIDGCARLRALLVDVTEDDLPSFQRQELNRGLTFSNETDLQLLLEGIKAPR